MVIVVHALNQTASQGRRAERYGTLKALHLYRKLAHNQTKLVVAMLRAFIQVDARVTEYSYRGFKNILGLN